MIAEMTGKTLQKKMFFRFFTRLAAMILLVCLEVTVSGAITLSNREVEALKKIGSVLGKTDWNFSVDPCSGEKGFDNSVSCDCSFANNTLCHVIGIALKGQNLSGSLPPELIRLPYLQELDLSRNYLNGSIPPEWGSTKLKLISLLGNRISGPIPIELGNITTLTNLTLSSNLLEGTLPPELGNLLHIEKLDFASNNLTGVLPSTLANLTKLKDFRVGDNQFSGSIPNFIQKWTHLEKLFIQGSGLDGPIPSAIASLTELTDLRISDVKGNFSSFPPLSSAKNMNTLILRSCNIDGPFPLYLGLMKNLEVLDLSFNSISGPVPSSFVASPDIHFIYLTSNFLTGAVPHWMVDSKANIDLSYNDFTPGSSKASTLQKPNLNMFNSEGNQMSTHSCSQNSRRPQYWYSLHINCGGKEHEVGGKHFENDTEVGGSANFFQSSTNWAVSSTGHFLDDTRTDSYTVTNSSRISGNSPELYMNARLSPLSLTYYGFCLLNGNYTVNLHFAEIMFTEDRTYSSLGRRIFDIYIQGKLMLEEFNIEDEAGGVNKPIIKRFPVKVIDNTLNIRFYWAGKGTMDMPVRGVYGPLISAISVDPDFTPPEHRDALSAGAKIGIVIAVLLIVCFLRVILRLICSLCDTLGRAFWALQLLWIRIIIQKTSFKLVDSRIFNVQTFSFTLEQIKAATNNFDVANKIGEGGFGCVYKGNLLNGQKVAVKQLSSQSEQGSREFVAEIGIISGLQHPNLVKLYGCCIEANQLILVYEYMENNSLAHALFGPEEHQLKLDWPARYNICVGTARALAFLHEESILKIVHRDIKSTNVLLDKNLEPKISDFGLAKLYEEVNAHTRTRIVGTLGYVAPEYFMTGCLTYKADVYSFGIVLLEIVSGKRNTRMPMEGFTCVLDWARWLEMEGKLLELVDSRLGSDFNREEVMLTINVALLCTNQSPDVRPSMSEVVQMLESLTDHSVRESEEMANLFVVIEAGERRPITMSADIPENAEIMENDIQEIQDGEEQAPQEVHGIIGEAEKVVEVKRSSLLPFERIKRGVKRLAGKAKFRGLGWTRGVARKGERSMLPSNGPKHCSHG